MMFRPFGATVPHASRHTWLLKEHRILWNRLYPRPHSRPSPIFSAGPSKGLFEGAPKRLSENGKGRPVRVVAESFPKGASCAAPASQRRGTKKKNLCALCVSVVNF